jgi:hypothetical protein
MAIPFILDVGKPRGPQPASGIHAELLAEIEQAARALIVLTERERTGVFDGFNQTFWVSRDPVLDTVRKLFDLASRRVGELRDVGRAP